jgi:predicted phosphodiesterase
VGDRYTKFNYDDEEIRVIEDPSKNHSFLKIKNYSLLNVDTQNIYIHGAEKIVIHGDNHCDEIDIDAKSIYIYGHLHVRNVCKLRVTQRLTTGSIFIGHRKVTNGDIVLDADSESIHVKAENQSIEPESQDQTPTPEPVPQDVVATHTTPGQP